MYYDYLIVGAGFFGATFANECKRAGKTCLVIDKRDHVAGNCYTKKRLGIDTHEYGAHIFHTSDKEVWAYANRYAEFNHYINSPIARYRNELYNMPFNMNTFSRLWNTHTPAQAREKIREQIAALPFMKGRELGADGVIRSVSDGSVYEPKNLEEQALSLVGTDVYEKLVKGYTEKQWGRPCTELPAFIIKRLPLRFTYDNNYFKDPYQGIPVEGFTAFAERLLEGVPVRLKTDFAEYRRHIRLKNITDKENSLQARIQREAGCAAEDTGEESALAGGSAQGETPVFGKILYTGMIDEYFDFSLGALEYRSLSFETKELPDEENYQGNAVVNYTEREVPYTRVIEHKHFVFGTGRGTVVTREYPAAWKPGDEPYYPVNDEKNTALYRKYRALADKEKDVLFGGRLGEYRYYDMDGTIAAALALAKKEFASSSC